MWAILCPCGIVDVMSTTRSELPLYSERQMGASCTLDEPQLRARLGAWGDLRSRARAVESVPDGIRLVLAPDEAMARVMDLVVSESECCAFYTFTVSVEGPERRLEISAGPGGSPAVDALLGLLD
jgi:hypothetical protein